LVPPSQANRVTEVVLSYSRRVPRPHVLLQEAYSGFGEMKRVSTLSKVFIRRETFVLCVPIAIAEHGMWRFQVQRLDRAG
jgi:hypothetical protein